MKKKKKPEYREKIERKRNQEREKEAEDRK